MKVVDKEFEERVIQIKRVSKYGASIIKMKPAPEGSGVIAGGAIRQVMELAGIKDISAKMLGSTNKGTSVKGAIEALSKFRKEVKE